MVVVRRHLKNMIGTPGTHSSYLASKMQFPCSKFSHLCNALQQRRSRRGALLQVLGQCKGIISAVVSVLCFHNLVPTLGWLGYGITVIGCIIYGRCKAHFRLGRIHHEPPNLLSTGVDRWLLGNNAKSRLHTSPSPPRSRSPVRTPHRPPLPRAPPARHAGAASAASTASAAVPLLDEHSRGSSSVHASDAHRPHAVYAEVPEASCSPYGTVESLNQPGQNDRFDSEVLKGPSLGLASADGASSPRARRAALKAGSSSASVRSVIPSSSPLRASEYSASAGSTSPDALTSNPSATLQTVLSGGGDNPLGALPGVAARAM